ncbi:hypothetical protein [Sphingomonas sp. LHG3443-2]|uniref:hypothetical protein n=1 Tax=Sphingomonas sp. LHG3443-2 TaxID=2804639 RepID=UPI003CF87374
MAILTALFFLASWHSLGRGGHERIAEAFRTQTLGMEIAGDRIPLQQRFNDCLITIMALEQRQPRQELFISPVNPAEPTQDVCRDLENGTGPNASAYYHNYLHGQTILLRYLLPHLELASIKAIYKGLLAMLLLASAGLCFLRVMDGSRREESLVFLVATLAFSRFFGLEWFGDSLGNGPSDLIVIGFLALLSARAGAMSTGEWIISAAVFGALTMIFELLTGGLPLGGAMVLGLGWFALKRGERSPQLVILGLVAYGLGAAIPMLTKVVLVATVFGSDALFQVALEGLNRIGSEVPPGLPELTVISQLVLHLGSLAPGMWMTAAGTLCLALALGAVALARHRSPEHLLLFASVALIFLWFALFRQHTALHASFMVRILVWPIAAGLALIALTALGANRVQPTR